MQEEIIRDLTQRRVTRIDRESEADDAGDEIDFFDVPRGAKVTSYDDDGEPNAYEMELLLDGWDDSISDDWIDAIIDDYGDYDDTDNYGDTAK